MKYEQLKSPPGGTQATSESSFGYNIELLFLFFNYVYLWTCRCQPVGGNREWVDAAGSQRSGKSLPSDKQKTLPADGRPGGPQRSGHHIRYLLVVVVVLWAGWCVTAASMLVLDNNYLREIIYALQ